MVGLPFPRRHGILNPLVERMDWRVRRVLRLPGQGRVEARVCGALTVRPPRHAGVLRVRLAPPQRGHADGLLRLGGD